MNLLFLDGGGTKLQATCYINNKIVGYAIYGSCNLTLDYEGAEANIYAGIEYFLKQRAMDAILISAAGAFSNPGLAQTLTNELIAHFNIPVKVISDIEYHYYKYLLKNDGCVINLGTGTSALTHTNGKRQIYFGYGPNFSEPGCGHDIGKALLEFLAYQEANNPYNTLYCKYLSDHKLITIRQNVHAFNHFSNSEMAAQAKWLLLLTGHSSLQFDVSAIINSSFARLTAWLHEHKFEQIYFIGGVINNNYVQDLLKSSVTCAHFNAPNNYTMEEIWNMLLA